MLSEVIPRPAVEEEFLSLLAEGHETVAVVSQPWSGRSQLLEAAADSFETEPTTISLEGPVSDSFSLPSDGPVIVERCQHLFQRRIGGFETVSALVEEISTREEPVVLGWNVFAWQYLTELTPLSNAFDRVYMIDPLDAEAAETLLTETLDVSDPENALAEAVDTELTEMADGERAVATTTLESTSDRLTRLRSAIRNRYRGSVVESHLEGLVSDAAGNPTAIYRLFQARTDPGIDELPNGFDFSYNEAYVLWLILAAGETTTAALRETTAEDVSLTVGRLERQGAIERTGDHVSVRPLAFGPVHSELSRRRLLW